MTLPGAQATFAATLVDEWVRAGMTDVVVSPGSRSTPLVLAAAAAHDRGALRVHVILDERCAGFTALGLGLATGRPAAVVTTSGSAGAHLLPAVIEASYARVPMLVCTADRPPELHDVGAPQTIDQSRLFGDLCVWRSDPGAVADLPPDGWRSFASRSIAEAATGPVHLNLGFRDPLVEPAGEMPPGRPDRRPWHRADGFRAVTGPVLTAAAALMDGRAGLIVADGGVRDPGPVLELGRALGWPVLAGPRGRCRGPSAGAEGAVVVSAFDAIVRHEAAQDALKPEAVLRLGTAPASKVLASWLRESGAEQVVADPAGVWPDPERTASVVVRTPPEDLCRSVLAQAPMPAPDGWAARWRAAEASAQQTIDAVLGRHPGLTEPGVARILTGSLPEEAALFVASSMPVRDVEWYGDPAMRCTVVANRGANGIDGMVSTALGLAAGRRGPVVALLGDLAFLHDSGGLLGAGRRGLHCTFVVVDNGGGGIFGFLPQAGTLPPATFERYFGTPQHTDLAALARAHGLAVEEAGDHRELVDAVGRDGTTVVVVRTDRAANVAVHDELVAAIGVAWGVRPGGL